MTESIPVSLIEKWITDLKAILKRSAQDAKTGTDLSVNQGMRHALDQIQHRLNTWLRHQENMEALARSGKQFLITKDVVLSDGRYRKLEWYEGNEFITLAWRHGAREERGELMLELQRVEDLSTVYLVYKGDLSFEALAGLARAGGLQSVKNEENQGEWVEKIRL